ncbi:MAG: hypothetical protein FJX74_19865 [Armatimonadetes bacterium]|nr:hypothetical protein [Armatimonadota bacterium]
MNEFRLELRPRNALDLIDASVRLYRRHFGSLLGISSLLLVPFGVTYTLGGFFYYAALDRGWRPVGCPRFRRSTFPR